MELINFIQAALDRVSQANARVTNTLSQEELSWQPNPEANSIGLILLHTARSEDMFVQSRMRGKPQIWETGKWCEKMNFAPSETVSGYTAEQLASFKTPDISVIKAYSDAVRAETEEYLMSLTAADLDKIVNAGRMGEVPVGTLFTVVVVHGAQHAGEISYIRGLKRGMNK